MFGKISIDNFNQNKINNLNSPTFNGSVPYDKFGEKMINSRATIIIGDPIYKSWGDLAQSIMIGNIVFIDSSYDFKKLVFKNNNELLDFNYVSSIREIQSKLDKIRDNDYRKYLLNLQRDCVKINKNEYCNNFVDLLENY